MYDGELYDGARDEKSTGLSDLYQLWDPVDYVRRNKMIRKQRIPGSLLTSPFYVQLSLYWDHSTHGQQVPLAGFQSDTEG